MTQITIAAAHKLAERLQREIDAKQAEIAQLARPLSARVTTDAARVVEQRTQFRKELEVLDSMHNMAVTLALRISEANDLIGLNSLLKERNLLTKKLAWVNSVQRTQKAYGSDAIEYNQVPEYFERLKSANSTAAVNINVLSDTMIAELGVKQKGISASLDSLNDQISQMNHSNMLTLDLTPTEWAYLGK
jgi:hypothetical protein